MNETSEPSVLLSVLPLYLVGVIFAVPAYMLAMEKGRKPWKWVLLCLVPLVNVFCIWYFIGTPSTRLENKLDELLKKQGRT